MKNQIEQLQESGLYRVERDADGELWGLFAPEHEGGYDSWHHIPDSDGEIVKQAIEAELLPVPQQYGANHGGV